MLTCLPGTDPVPSAPRPSVFGREKLRLPGFFAALLLAVALILPLTAPATAQEAAPLQAASGPLSERTMVLVGRTVQTAGRLHFFGYLNAASGLAGQDLFADDTDQVASARFTFSADVALQPATNRADTTSFGGEGTLGIYLATSGGADWRDPASFSAGDLVADYDVSLRETLQRQAANVGVLVGDGTLTQATANTFTLGDATYRFGVEGLGQRLRFTGALTPDTAGNTLVAGVNGYAEVTSRDVKVVRLGQTSAPAATPAPAETSAAPSACALEPWLGNATTALALADQGLSNLDVSATDTVDVVQAQGLAGEIDDAIATLRGSTPPDEAASANRLLVTALSTTSRGLRAVAFAADSGDATSFSQAAAALGDGRALLSQAQGNITNLSATCPSG